MVNEKKCTIPDFKPGRWSSDKKYYDDSRSSAILKKNSIDAYGHAEYGKRQNMYDNYVYDLQTDLRKMDFLEVGRADGWLGEKTKTAVESFQLAALISERAIDGTPTRISNVTFGDEIDGIVGNKTKAEIKIWLENKYANPLEINHSVPLIPQKYGMSCWAASIQMILAYNGIEWTQEEICDNAGLPRSRLRITGLFLKDNIQAAENLGFGLIEHPRASMPVSTWVRLLKERGPLIVAKKIPYKHTAVLKGITKDPNDPLVFINDPEPVNVGTDRIISLSDFNIELSSNPDWCIFYFRGPECIAVSVEEFPHP